MSTTVTRMARLTGNRITHGQILGAIADTLAEIEQHAAERGRRIDPAGLRITTTPAELGAVQVRISADLTDPITSSHDDTIDPDNEP